MSLQELIRAAYAAKRKFDETIDEARTGGDPKPFQAAEIEYDLAQHAISDYVMAHDIELIYWERLRATRASTRDTR